MVARFYPRQQDYIEQLNALDANVTLALSKGDTSQASMDAAAASAVLASKWATQATTEVVGGQGYSAKQYAINAGAFATTAQGYRDTAQGYMISALGYKDSALGYRDSALGYRDTANGAATAAMGYRDTAESHSNDAYNYTASALDYRNTTLDYRNTAGTYATLAQNWATQSAGEVVGGQGYSAKKYAVDAAASAAAAEISANQASSGQINADWNVSDPLQKAYIANKPTIPTTESIALKANTLDLQGLSSSRANRDANGIYTTVEFRRFNGMLVRKSILSGGVSPTYTTRTETIYGADGVTVTDTFVFALGYSEGELISEAPV